MDETAVWVDVSRCSRRFRCIACMKISNCLARCLCKNGSFNKGKNELTCIGPIFLSRVHLGTQYYVQIFFHRST